MKTFTSAGNHQAGRARNDALVEAARRGEAEAWERIYDHLGHRLTRYAASRGITDPEDVTQDVMYAAAQRINRFSGDWENLRSWLFTIAYRRCADHHRRRARSPEQLTHLPPEDPDFDTCADGRLWADGEAREAFAALAILEDREREVVALRVIDEMTTREVAAALALSPSNVRVIQSRALAKLRRYLEANGGFLDRRFRTLLPPAVLALEKIRLLRRLADKAEGWVTRGRFGSPMETLTGSTTVTSGLTHALTAVMIAAGVTAGGLHPGTPPPEIAARAAHPEPTAIGPFESDRVDQSEGREIHLEPRPSDGDNTDRRLPADVGTAAQSGTSSSLGIGRRDGSVADGKPLWQLTAAVEEEGSPVETSPVTAITGGTAVEPTTSDVVEASEPVTDSGPMERDGDAVGLPETHGAVDGAADDAGAELTDQEPDSLLDG